MVSHVAKLENFNEELAYISSKIEQELPALHRNTYTKRNYKDYYTAESKAVISKIYARDIALFDYTFDS